MTYNERVRTGLVHEEEEMSNTSESGCRCVKGATLEECLREMGATESGWVRLFAHTPARYRTGHVQLLGVLLSRTLCLERSRESKALLVIVKAWCRKGEEGRVTRVLYKEASEVCLLSLEYDLGSQSPQVTEAIRVFVHLGGSKAAEYELLARGIVAIHDRLKGGRDDFKVEVSHHLLIAHMPAYEGMSACTIEMGYNCLEEEWYITLT